MIANSFNREEPDTVALRQRRRAAGRAPRATRSTPAGQGWAAAANFGASLHGEQAQQIRPMRAGRSPTVDVLDDLGLGSTTPLSLAVLVIEDAHTCWL